MDLSRPLRTGVTTTKVGEAALVCRARGGTDGHRQLLSVLQPSTVASESGLPNAGRDLPGLRDQVWSRTTKTRRRRAKGCGKAAPRKSPKNGLFHLAWKSAHPADFHFPHSLGGDWNDDLFQTRTNGIHTIRPCQTLYCRQKMVLTLGSTLPFMEWPRYIPFTRIVSMRTVCL
jgi:hypothetical protein